MINLQDKQAIINWLYINDGKFNSKNEWREKFVEFMDSISHTEEKTSCSHIVDMSPESVVKDLLDCIDKVNAKQTIVSSKYPYGKSLFNDDIQDCKQIEYINPKKGIFKITPKQKYIYGLGDPSCNHKFVIESGNTKWCPKCGMRTTIKIDASIEDLEDIANDIIMQLEYKPNDKKYIIGTLMSLLKIYANSQD